MNTRPEVVLPFLVVQELSDVMHPASWHAKSGGLKVGADGFSHAAKHQTIWSGTTFTTETPHLFLTPLPKLASSMKTLHTHSNDFLLHVFFSTALQLSGTDFILVNSPNWASAEPLVAACHSSFIITI